MSRKKIKLTPRKGKPPAKMAKGGIIESGILSPLRNGRDKTDDHMKFARNATNAALKVFGQKGL